MPMIYPDHTMPSAQFQGKGHQKQTEIWFSSNLVPVKL